MIASVTKKRCPKASLTDGPSSDSRARWRVSMTALLPSTHDWPKASARRHRADLVLDGRLEAKVDVAQRGDVLAGLAGLDVGGGQQRLAAEAAGVAELLGADVDGKVAAGV